MSEKRKIKGKNIYLLVLALATAAAIIVGLAVHSTGLFIKGEHIEETLYEGNSAEIKVLEIDSGVMNVNVHPGDTFKVSYSGDSTQKPAVTAVNGHLNIKQDDKFTLNVSVSDSKLDVTLPPGTEFEGIYLDSGVGEMKASDLKTRHMEINGGVGHVEITGSDLGDLKAESGVGHINVTNTSLGNFTAESGVGEVKIEGCTVKDINVSSGTGRVKMQLKNSLADYYMELDAGVGGIIYNGKEINGSYVQNGNGGRCIIESDVGSVELTDPQKKGE